MGLFSGLFGGGDKTDFGALFPDPPKLELTDIADFDNGINSIIEDYINIKNGTGRFDAIQSIFKPQEALINREFGIGTVPGDVFGEKTGALQRLRAGLNQRGLLDAGTSALLESQVEADRIRQLAEVFGNASVIQGNRELGALQALPNLFDTQFQTSNIQNNLDFFNAERKFAQDERRNLATEADRLQRNANEAAFGSGLLQLGGAALGSFFGPAGTALGSQIGGAFGGANQRYSGGSLPNFFGTSSTFGQSNPLLKSSFGTTGGGSGLSTPSFSNFFSALTGGF